MGRYVEEAIMCQIVTRVRALGGTLTAEERTIVNGEDFRTRHQKNLAKWDAPDAELPMEDEDEQQRITR